MSEIEFTCGTPTPPALRVLAMAYFRERRYEEALALYRTLEELRPDRARTHSKVGATLYRLGRPEEALQSIERALALDPGIWKWPAPSWQPCTSTFSSRIAAYNFTPRGAR